MKELEKQLIRAVVGAIDLHGFELLLYKQKELSELMEDEFVLKLYSINFKDKWALDKLKSIAKERLGEDVVGVSEIKYLLIQVLKVLTLETEL